MTDISKAASLMGQKSAKARVQKWGRKEFVQHMREWGKLGGGSKARREATARVATIPNELATCVADYAERLLEQTHMSKPELLGSGPIPSGQSSEHYFVDESDL